MGLKWKVAGLITLLFLSACMESDPTSSGNTLPSRNVRIEIDGVVVGPGKANQDLWDCCGAVDQQTWQAFTQLASATGLVTLSAPASELLRYVANLSGSHFSAPEPIGVASIDIGNGYALPISLNRTTDDSFIASFGDPGWSNIQLGAGLRIKLDLYDEDLSANDFIGTAILNTDDVQMALENKKVIDIYVGDQTNRQILFVKISANYM